ncbi:MAG: GtrA family protein [Myxococcales bacterium]|nr:GtrA family protein [Myxococcales bacterium]
MAARGWALLGKHQVSALVATGVDFGVMIALVELLRLSPVLATVLGALSGAVTNFTLGRSWTFAAKEGAPAGQAMRYLVVSAASLGWNALGVHVGVKLGVPYVAARVVVAILISFLWNFPLHRYFVFKEARHR